MENPFLPPQETAQPTSVTAKRQSAAYVIATILWSMMAVLVAVVVPTLRSMFADLEIQIPLLTRVLLHPMATVFFFVIAAAVVVSGVVTNTATQRRKTGRIACVLWIVTVTACAIGLVVPIVTLIEQLS